MGTILVIILILPLVGPLPTWPCNSQWVICRAGWLARRIQIILLVVAFKQVGVVPEARWLQGIIL
jgi:hypothetical protein